LTDPELTDLEGGGGWLTHGMQVPIWSRWQRKGSFKLGELPEEPRPQARKPACLPACCVLCSLICSKVHHAVVQGHAIMQSCNHARPAAGECARTPSTHTRRRINEQSTHR